MVTTRPFSGHEYPVDFQMEMVAVQNEMDAIHDALHKNYNS